MAFRHVWLDTDRGICIGSQSTPEIESLTFIVAIEGTTLEMSSYVEVSSDKNVPSTVNLWVASFIEYLAQRSMANVHQNTDLFQAIIDGIKREFMCHFNGSFIIRVRTNSFYLTKDERTPIKPFLELPDGTKAIATDTPSPPFKVPDPEFLFVRR